MKKQKKEYPPGTFIATPARIAAIVQLCLAFTVIFWNMSSPFMEKHFSVRSRLLLYDYVLAKTEKFQSLSEEVQGALLGGYQLQQAQFNLSFGTKLREAFHRIAFEIAPFERAWLVLSLIIPILLLKRVEGARAAVWLLPLLTAFYALDNQWYAPERRVGVEWQLFPEEKELLKSPLPANIFEQQKQLRNAWENYLILEWTEEKPSEDSQIRQKQMEKGEFAFTVARILSQQKESRFPFNVREPVFLLCIYLLWNLLFACLSIPTNSRLCQQSILLMPAS